MVHKIVLTITPDRLFEKYIEENPNLLKEAASIEAAQAYMDWSINKIREAYITALANPKRKQGTYWWSLSGTIMKSYITAKNK